MIHTTTKSNRMRKGSNKGVELKKRKGKWEGHASHRGKKHTEISSEKTWPNLIPVCEYPIASCLNFSAKNWHDAKAGRYMKTITYRSINIMLYINYFHNLSHLCLYFICYFLLFFFFVRTTSLALMRLSKSACECISTDIYF